MTDRYGIRPLDVAVMAALIAGRWSRILGKDAELERQPATGDVRYQVAWNPGESFLVESFRAMGQIHICSYEVATKTADWWGTPAEAEELDIHGELVAEWVDAYVEKMTRRLDKERRANGL